MRPRLLEHVRYVESEDGVYVQGDHGACTIVGRHSYAWMSRLAPLLTGEHTLGELVAPLSAERRELVERLVEALVEQRLVTDAQDEEPHTLAADECEVYAPEIAFVRYAAGSAERRFERLREARVALFGGGPVLAALVEAGVRSGWRDVRVIDTGEVPADLVSAAERGRRDAAQAVRVLEGVDPRAMFADADVVLHVCEGDEVGEPARVGRACARQGVALGQVWVRREEAWLTPVSAAETESCWRRLAALPYQESGEDGAWLTGAVPAVLAAQLALSCFEHLTGTARAAKQPYLTRVDLRTLDTRRHRLHTCSLAAPQGKAASAEAERLAGAAPVTAGDLLDQVSRYVDPRTGVLGSLDEEGLVQTPLAVCRSTVSDPGGVLPAWSAAPAVYGWGHSREEARLRTTLAALATYQWLATGGRDPWWGVHPVSGHAQAVPAPLRGPAEEEPAEVPALLRGSGACRPPLAGVYRAPVGVAVGLSWAEAVAAGLAQHCDAYLREVDHAAFPVVAPVAEVSDLVALLEAAGERVEIRDLTQVLGLPAYAFLAEGRARTACAMTAAGAMRRGLERVLLAWQSRTERQPSYADPPARWPEDDLDGKALAEALAGVGRVPVAVPLGGDAEVARLLPFTAWVVCRDA